MTTRYWGSTINVNTTSAGEQGQPAVTALADGGFMIAWTDDGPADSVTRAQRFDALGNMVGGELSGLNSFGPPGDQTNPDIVQLGNGNLWISYTDFENASSDNAESTFITPAGAFAGAYGVAFSPFDDEEQTALTALGSSSAAAVYVNRTSNDGDIFVDIIGVTGATIVDDLQVNSDVAGSLASVQWQPDIAANADGSRFAVVWTDEGLNGSDIRCRIFDTAGSPVTAEFTVNTSAGNLAAPQSEPAIAWLDSEKLVVVWPSGADGQGDPSQAVKYAIYSANGTLLVPEQLANTKTQEAQLSPAVTALRDGGFVIAWTDFIQNPFPTGDIRLQVFDGNGAKRGGEIVVHTNLDGSQVAPSLATLADGRVVVTWDDSSGEVFAQIIDPRDGQISGTVAPETLYGHEGVDDQITGFEGDDVIYGLGGDDTVYGGVGLDDITLGRGEDTGYGGGANDTLRGNGGDDLLFGENENDTLTGGRGEDELFGGSGTDTLNGGADNDVLSGGAGDDTLIGGLGADAMNGGSGNDVADFSSATAGVNVALNGTFNNTGEAAGDTFISVEYLVGSAFNDVLRGSSGSNAINGGLGNDRIEGLEQTDVMIGGGGNDTFFFNKPADGGFSGDFISDFGSAPGNDDRFEIRGGNFGGAAAGLATGPLLANQFQSSTFDTAQTATVRFFYETDTGRLFYDRDGSAGAFGPQLLATLQTGAVVALSDFTII